MTRTMTRTMTRFVTAIVAAFLLAGAAMSARAEPLSSACTKSYAPQTLDLTQQPINLGQLKNQLYFYACSGAYDSDLNKVLGAARAYVEVRAAKVVKPALVLDIDETSLSNLPLELIDDFAYINGIPCKPKLAGPCGFDSWVALAEAKAIDGTLALFNAAKVKNVAVFFITGRHVNEQEPTVKNLKGAGFDGWAGLVLRAQGDNRSVIAYKSGEREKLAEQGYTIIANVGDQDSDLAGGYAERAYKLPNPFYFIP
jgi:predicted secreted acid phosphatase